MKIFRNLIFNTLISTFFALSLISVKVNSLPLLLDLLTSSAMGVDWIASNTSRAQITSLNQLRLYNGYVDVQSKVYDFSNANGVTLDFDVTVPFNILGLIGPAPNPGENLRVDFLRNDGNWQTLTTFVADSGFLGIISVGGAFSYSQALPASAYHDNFKLRYVMLGGGVGLFDLLGDNWYVSNIVLDADVTPNAPDHYRLAYASSALTCEPHSVSIQVCADASCSALFTDSVTVTLSPSGWSGGNTFTFSGGSTTAALSQTTPGTVTLGVAASTPSTTGGATQCSIGGGAYSSLCDLTYAEAGFVVSIPEFISGRGENATIQAVKKSDASTQCVPAFANVSKTIKVWSQYSLPNTGTLPVYASSPSVALGQTAPAATSISAAFNASGVATVAVNYSDAGYVKLNAIYTGSGVDAGLSMVGDATFLARPAGMCVQTDGECISPLGGNYANCDVFEQAGASFPLTVSAVAWQADGETNFCDGNSVTPNYTSNGDSVAFSSSVVSPAAGDSGQVSIYGSPTVTDYLQTSGSQIVDVNQIEVGVFNIGVTPPPYYGATLGNIGDATPVTFTSQPTGRFIPAYFSATVTNAGALAGEWTGVFAATCNATFAYSGQELPWLISPAFSIVAKNLAGNTTQNYTQGDFLKLTAAGIGITAPSADNTQTGKDTSLLPVSAVLYEGSLVVNGTTPSQLDYEMSMADTLTYDRSLNSEVAGFTPALTYVVSAITDSDNVNLDSPVNFNPLTGFELRFGRLYLDDNYGPEDADLDMFLTAQYFNGMRYVRHNDDVCTTWDSGLAAVTPLTLTQLRSSTGTFVLGAGTLTLIAPTNVAGATDTGEAEVTYAAPSYLTGDYDGDGNFEDPTANARFGVYRGHDRVIYKKEIR
ncbi:MAG: hypothetical protein P1U57_00795 [Oleibacter sp.]|nr:hypothetical protein [Thalassolituus sp.]